MRLLPIPLVMVALLSAASARVCAADWDPVAVLKHTYGPARFSPDGKVLATWGKKGILLWETKHWKLLATLELPDPVPTEVIFSADGKMLAAGFGLQVGVEAQWSSGGIKIWELTSRKVRRILLVKEKGLVAPVVFSRDGKSLAAAFLGKDSDLLSHKVGDGWRDKVQVKRWDITTGKELKMPPAKGEPLAKLVFTPFGTRLLSAKPGVDLSGLATGQWPVSVWVDFFDLNRTSVHGKWRASVARVYKGKGLRDLFGGTAAKSVELRDMTTGKTFSLKHSGPVARLAFSPDGKLLAVGEKGGGLTLWDTATKGILTWEPGETDYIVFGVNGRFLLCGPSARSGLFGTVGRIKVWEVAALLKQKGLE